MKISLVIPFYNGEKFCEKIFDMIFKQTYQNYEVICIDDGSTDNTLNILKKIEKKHKQVKVFTQKNTGPGFARKLGFQKSNGDIILFYDSDDSLYDENVFQNIVHIFGKENPDIIFYDLIITSKSGEYISKVIKDFDLRDEICDISLLENCLFKTNLCNKVFKRKLLNDDMFYNGSNFEDAYTLLSYLQKCNNFYYSSKHFYVNNEVLNPNSLTKTVDSKKILQMAEVLNFFNDMNRFNNLKEYKFFDLYCYHFKNLLINKNTWSEEEINSVKKELKNMRSIFKGKALKLSLKYFSLKRYALYLISLIYI